jgi:Tfp pilus assembly PilM family ATPase
MPQLLALEWNGREIRIAMASGRDRQVVIEHAFSVPWNAEGNDLDKPEQRIAEQITKELSARGISCKDVLVAVGRTSIELRPLQLPPAPEADLPDMVQFQAAREFNELNDQWRLDFVPIDEAPDGTRTVLAAAIAPAMIQQIETVCQKAELNIRRLLLRPCEAAALLVAGSKAVAPEQLQLLVDLLADEADLTAVINGKAVFLRTTRFSGDPPPVAALLAEIRLTMAAVQNQVSDRKVESIVLCGGDAMHTDLARRIETELGMSVQLFDPFGAVELSPALKKALPPHSGRYAPLLGILMAEFRQTSHAIDFLHPRRRPEAPSRRKRWIIAGAAVGCLALAYLIYARIDNILLDNEVDALRAKSVRLSDDIKATKKTSDNSREIAKWADGEVVWLDQLYSLTQSFPPAEDAVLGELACGPQRGNIDLKGWVRNEGVLAKMGESLRTNVGQITPKGQKEDQSMRPYSWHFETSVVVRKGPAETPAPAKKAATESSPPSKKGVPETSAPSKKGPADEAAPPTKTPDAPGAPKDSTAPKKESKP